MKLLKKTCWMILAVALAFSVAVQGRVALAHGSGVLVQDGFGTLVTGDAESESLAFVEQRVFSAFLPSLLAWNEPSFLSQSAPPEGTLALPQNADVLWDFLPMTIGGSTANLWYWDGLATEQSPIHLTRPPRLQTTLTLFGRNNAAAHVDGTDQAVPGKTLARTLAGSGLRLHAHQFFVLDDGDGMEATTPAAGLYLAAMQLRMAGLHGTKPFYLVFGTVDATTMARDRLVDWVNPRVDELIREGDYDFNGTVDGGDFLLWQRRFDAVEAVTPTGDRADGNANGVVDQHDLELWEAAWGSRPASFGGVQVVPEPKSVGLALAIATFFSCRRCRVLSSHALKR